MKPRMRRRNFNADGDYDSWPVMVPRNDKTVIPTSPERVRRLRRRLIVTLRALRTMKNPERSVAPLRPEPEGFAGRVARTACSLCKGWCCKNGEDDAFLDEGTSPGAREAVSRIPMARRDLTVEWRDIASLIPYARNARSHSDAQVAQI